MLVGDQDNTWASHFIRDLFKRILEGYMKILFLCLVQYLSAIFFNLNNFYFYIFIPVLLKIMYKYGSTIAYLCPQYYFFLFWGTTKSHSNTEH